MIPLRTVIAIVAFVLATIAVVRSPKSELTWAVVLLALLGVWGLVIR